MKTKNTTVILFIGILLLRLTSCSTNKTTIDGKYINVLDESIYYEFSNDNSYSTNNVWDIPIDSSSGSYTITDNVLILYANDNEDYSMNLGFVYKDYICSSWNGVLPMTDKNTSVSITLVDNLTLSIEFKEDNTYVYTVTSNGEIVHTENGTYSINSNEVVCTNEDKQITTFIEVDDNIYCIEYVKE